LAFLLSPGWACAQQQPAPEILLQAPLLDLAGQPAALARFSGQPMLINFWARWCGPCRVEIPEIAAQYPLAQKAGVQIIGVALDDKPGAVRDFAKAYEMDYPQLLLPAKDSAVTLFTALGNPQVGLPYSLAIDRDGKIVMRKLGAMSRAELIAAIGAAAKK
jgi:thiol-disulfide isomerase/thioredoxin